GTSNCHCHITNTQRKKGLDLATVAAVDAAARRAAQGRALVAAFAVALVVLAGLLSTGLAAANPVRIGIVQFVEHPALDAFRLGFVQALEDSDYAIGQDIILDYQNSQGDFIVARTIAEKFVQDR